MAFFIEVLVGGLLAGVMYSLVALGFVLIFKASGVFNFAQGAMVLAAATTYAGLVDMGWSGWTAFLAALAAMVLFALATERLVLRPLVNQPPINLGNQGPQRALYQFTLQDTDTETLYRAAPLAQKMRGYVVGVLPGGEMLSRISAARNCAAALRRLPTISRRLFRPSTLNRSTLGKPAWAGNSSTLSTTPPWRIRNSLVE